MFLGGDAAPEDAVFGGWILDEEDEEPAMETDLDTAGVDALFAPASDGPSPTLARLPTG